MRLRFWQRGSAAPRGGGQQESIGAEIRELSTVFAPPRWLRDLGRSAWMLVGVFALLAGVVWLLGVTSTIVTPVITATIVAVVTSPLVAAMERHRVPRLVGAVTVLVLLLALALLIAAVVIGGIEAQRDQIAAHSSKAVDHAGSWLKDVGVDQQGVSKTTSHVSSSTPGVISALAKGVIHGIEGLASFVFACTFAALSLFFLLKDGPTMRRWLDGHLGVPRSVAQTITGGVIRSLRGYFKGVTIVAAFNGIVVGLGALLLGVPLAGTIAIVTFVTAYVPYIGALAAGAVAVVLALGSQGTTTALIMLVIVILANGLLQNIVQPFAMGSALDLHPLVVLVVTIGGGCIFGMVGLILAAPLASAAVHIYHDLERASRAAELEAADKSPP
jgi:predicted PurR-regulated permease PerM